MAGCVRSWTGTGKGAGWHWRGAGGPGGRGGMFEGSEGPGRAAGGRYERRQTRQVLSALFFTYSQNLHCGAMWQQRNGGDRRCGWAATHSFLDTSYSERTPEGRELAGTGASHHRRSATTLQNILAHTGCRRCSAWDDPGTSASRLRSIGACRVITCEHDSTATPRPPAGAERRQESSLRRSPAGAPAGNP